MATPRSFPAHITITVPPPPESPVPPADERPIEVRMLDLASKLGALLAEAHVIPTSGATPGAGLLSDIALALTDGASSLLGKDALLRQLVDAYTAAGGEGVATLGAIEAAITRGVGVTNGLRDLSAAYLEALGEPVGAWTPSIADMRAAITRGAR